MSQGPGLRFECTQCGECCTNRDEYAYVYVNDEEVEDLALALGIGVSWFKRRYTFVDEDGWRQLTLGADACVFLEPGTVMPTTALSIARTSS